MQGLWEYFLQTVHPGTVQLHGDTADGRTPISESGRMCDGRSELNHSIYHDRYERTADGWRFAERVHEVRYIDTTPLRGTTPTAPVSRYPVRHLAERDDNIVRFTDLPRGGHFAAMEQPELVADDIKAFFATSAVAS